MPTYKDIERFLMNVRGNASARANPHLSGSGFWGTEGAGVLPLAADTGRLLLGRRSELVNEPGTWGTWGGATRGTGEGDEDSPGEGALREFEEESGWFGSSTAMTPIFEFRRPNFIFRNFLLVLPHEFEPSLNWEHDDAEWFSIENLPESLHFGLRALLDDPASRAEIGRWIRPRRRRDRTA